MKFDTDRIIIYATRNYGRVSAFLGHLNFPKEEIPAIRHAICNDTQDTLGVEDYEKIAEGMGISLGDLIIKEVINRGGAENDVKVGD